MPKLASLQLSPDHREKNSLKHPLGHEESASSFLAGAEEDEGEKSLLCTEEIFL